MRLSGASGRATVPGRNVVVRDPDAERSIESLDGDLREARPGEDAVGMDEVRARAERVLFGAAEPARLGRFVLFGPIAGGGMGMVYGAYDPQLDRQVALKVIHPRQRRDLRARARLLGEARALARLDHPNVVPIHDVLEVDDQIVLVMELVSGQTLAAWERAAVHPWREIIAVYVEAGRGLAAVHRLGLAHRDFKPANAIVGDDGRVRVLDFGLARADGDDALAPTEPGGAPSAAPSLTATGEVLGTIGFMAPEQLRGDTATAASDQFSFCVALHRAVYGAPPFTGSTIAELQASMEAGRIDPGPGGTRAPGWLRAVLARGLATDPAARFPAMVELLAQLERERGWRRWRGPAAVVAVVAAAATAAIVVTRPAPDVLAACDGGRVEIEEVWNQAERGRIAAAIAAPGTPYASATTERVVRELEDYRDAWSAQHGRACKAHRRGALSAALLDRTMACLHKRRRDLAAATSVLGRIDPAAVSRAVDVAVGLPPVADCGDLDRVEREGALPVSAAARAQVTVLEARMGHAETLERVGRAREALAAVVAIVADARRVGHPPLLVDMLLAEGRLRLMRRELVEARVPLAAAKDLALEHGLFAAAVIAGARLIYVDGQEGRALDSLLGEAGVFEPISRGLRGDRFARPLLLNSIGVLHMSRGQREPARAAFEAALAAREAVGGDDLELTSIDKNLAMITADPVAREARAREVWVRLRDRLGAQHLLTIQALYVYAHYVVDPTEALRLASDACGDYQRFHAELIPSRAACVSYAAFLTAETGDAAGAARLYDEVVAFAAGSEDEDAVAWRGLAAGHLGLSRGEDSAALAHFEAIRVGSAGRTDWWERQRTAHALLGAALAERALGRTRDALAHLDEAAAIYTEITALNESVDNHQRLAIARRAAAAIRDEP